MKKNVVGTLAAAICSIFLLASCAPAPATGMQPSGNDLILAAKGEVTHIETSGDTTSITVDGDDTDSNAAYKLLVAHLTGETPVIDNGNASAYTDGSLSVGDEVEIYLAPNTPVTASEPPQAMPVKVVVTEREAEGSPAAGASGPADVKTEYEGKITEITPDGEYYLVYVQKEENGDPLDDLRAVVSSDTKIISEQREASGLTPGELQVGDEVTVTTNGIATFSIPPQSSAQKIVIHDAGDK